MKKLIFLLAACFSTTYALLPPLAQSVREIEAILSDPRLYQSLGSGEKIVGIERTDSGYVVMTHNYSLQVTIVYHALPYPGPARFMFEFQVSEPIPK